MYIQFNYWASEESRKARFLASGEHTGTYAESFEVDMSKVSRSLRERIFPYLEDGALTGRSYPLYMRTGKEYAWKTAYIEYPTHDQAVQIVEAWLDDIERFGVYAEGQK